MKRTVHELMIMLLAMCCVSVQAGAQDSIPDEDFVIASLLIASPGDAVYSRFGHCAIRMQCPEHGLDYVFSYESDDAGKRVISFLAGKLRMGLFAVHTQDYLKPYSDDGRGMMEYVLNLPLDVKRNLWRVLDNHMLLEKDVPYDFIERGCAYGSLQLIKEALDTIGIEYGEWPSEYSLSRREICHKLLDNHPWDRAFTYFFVNGCIDSPCSREEKIILPQMLLERFETATVAGQKLLDGNSVELLPVVFSQPEERPLVTPLMVSILLLAIALVCLLTGQHCLDVPLLIIQALLGLAVIYLTFFSTLCCTEWNWLIIPFTPLPLIGWHWRKAWFRWYAYIILVWSAVMLLWPHILTDSAYIVLSSAFAVNMLSITDKTKQKTR